MSQNHESRITNHELRITHVDGYRLLLWFAIIGYLVLFSRLASDLHLGMRTHKADLGQIAQAIWNSSRGRFVESTDTGIIASRLTDHVEPILALVSPVLWLWDDVRALLLLQVTLVAIGAWPLYELALKLLDKSLSVRERSQIWQLEPLRQLTRPMALALALTYLLTPQLQSAILTEFHAAPLAVPLILWAFWAIESRQLGHFVIATLLVAAVKEEMALLAAGLGLWQFWISPGTPWAPAKIISLGVTLTAVTWFFLATFVIIPAHAPQIYDTAESVYFGRYGALGDSPVDIVKSFFTQPGLVWQIATEPARVRYLWGLLAPFGLLSLLAPEIIVLALPLLLANLLSAYPAQYYGEFHYSAPLVPYIAVSAAYGLERLWRWLSRKTNRTSASYQHMAAASISVMTLASLFTNARTALRPLLALGFTLWLLGWSAAAYGAVGRGPLGGRYDPTPITAHARLLPRFLAQIPADAAVTATAAVHPHISHRRYVYQFPIGVAELGEAGQAEWALLDVTTNTDMAPGDVKHAVETLLAGEWGVIDGADGFLLLQRGATAKQIPDAFYDFARGEPKQGVIPTTDTDLIFAGATVEDWPRWRQTRINPCWQVGAALPNRPVMPQLEVITPAGDRLYAFSTAAPPALVWYPPERWQEGETVCLKTLPLPLPRIWGLRVTPSGPITAADLAPAIHTLLRSPEGLTLVQLFQRTTKGTIEQILASRALGDQAGVGVRQMRVQGTFLVADREFQAILQSPEQLAPGAMLDLPIVWQSDKGADWPANLSVFIHLRQGEQILAQADGQPRFFQLGTTADLTAENLGITEWRQITLPATLLPGATLTVALGLYDPATGERMPLRQATGQSNNNELRLPPLTVIATPVPDQACALLPATCASQPAP